MCMHVLSFPLDDMSIFSARLLFSSEILWKGYKEFLCWARFPFSTSVLSNIVKFYFLIILSIMMLRSIKALKGKNFTHKMLHLPNVCIMINDGMVLKINWIMSSEQWTHSSKAEIYRSPTPIQVDSEKLRCVGILRHWLSQLSGGWREPGLAIAGQAPLAICLFKSSKQILF